MKQPGVLVILIIFVAAVSFVLASEQYKRGRSKTVTLNSAELSTHGDPDATGTLKFTLKPMDSQFCYELSVSNIGVVTAANISSSNGEAGTSNLVSLQTPVNGSSIGCVTVDADKIGNLVRNPANYYVSVLTTDYPEGAIRAQLK